MNILIVSDDHGIPGFEKVYLQAKKKYGQIDYVFHSGDSEKMDASEYQTMAACPVYMVRGNNDYGMQAEFVIAEIAGKRIFMTHGHRYNVYSGIDRLSYRAEEEKADVVIFGHTHHAFYKVMNGIVYINPGSITLPRGSKIGMFAVMTIEDDGNIRVEHYSV